jgi:hypothetical protein
MDMSTKERKFGEIPDWAKTGPIDRLNYSCRAEKHCAVHGVTREGSHPTIKRGDPNFRLWAEYFDRHLGGRPMAFAMLCEGSIKEMTVPEPTPQWFDPSFTPTPGWSPP